LSSLRFRPVARLFRRVAPRQRFFLVAVLAIMIIAVSARVVLSSPWLGLELVPSAEPAGLRILSVHPDSPNTDSLEAGMILVAIESRQGQRIELDGNLVMEEPDLLGYADLDIFIARQTALDLALHEGGTRAVTAEGERLNLRAEAAPLHSLSGGFAVHTFYGLIALAVAVGLWAFRPGSPATRLYGLSGVATMINTQTLAIYGDREFILSGEVFQWVMAVNHLATLMVCASLASLFWVYPRPLGRTPVPGIIIAVTLIIWVLSELKVGDSAQYTIYMPVVVGYLAGLGFATAQWIASWGRPVERAALKWCVLAIFLGSVLLMGLIMIPPAFGQQPLVPLLVGFAAYLILYIGIAAGLVRYRLFDIERWWFKAWLWFAGGLIVLVLDAILIMGAGLTNTHALAISLAIAGWVYFPLRQWLWSRFGQRTSISLNDALQALVDKLFSAATEAQVRRAWPDLLRMTFEPLNVRTETAPNTRNSVSVSNDGVLMAVPPLAGEQQQTCLEFAGNGARLFSREDIQVADLLHALTSKALLALQARDAGADKERSRIMRDLHDDLGARLLSLVYATDTDTVRDVARSALTDLHGLVDATAGQPVSLIEVANTCEGEIRQRLGNSSIALDWLAEPSTLPRKDVSARAATNIARILREAVSNIIKHAEANRVEVRWRTDVGELSIRIADNGTANNASGLGEGQGLRIMQVRAQDLGGRIEWRSLPERGFEVNLSLPVA